MIKSLFHTLCLTLMIGNCHSQVGEKASVEAIQDNQDRFVGGPCEGCEALFEFGQRDLSPVDTLPEFASSEPKLMLTGTVYQNDGRTLAEDVILYIYHTNREGVYPMKGDELAWARRHGYLRGWVRTDQDGQYAFYTFRPGAYPGGSEPEHIHITIKEPHSGPYYIDAFVFEDDPLLASSARASMENRGGSGVVQPLWKDSMLVVSRDIILGKNIPGYK